MPHKRAKRSVREQQRSQLGHDLAPAKTSQQQQQEAIPKSIARVLNAHHVREQWQQTKRKREDDTQKGAVKKHKAQIKPGESMSHFNKRVEDDMRPLVLEASKGAKMRQKPPSRRAKPHSNGDTDPPPAPPPDKHAGRPKEFQACQTSAPRRLNDVAQAPPEFKLSRVTTTTKPLVGIVSIAQKQMMEKERENAIRRYRELKAQRAELNVR